MRKTYAIPLVTVRLPQPAGESGAVTTGCCCCCCCVGVGVVAVAGAGVSVTVVVAVAAAVAEVISDSGCCDSAIAAIARPSDAGDGAVGGSPLLHAIEQ